MQTTTSPLPVETVAIVGAGAMGRGIAQITALAGLTVKLFDTNPQALDAARAYLAETFARLADKGKLSAGDGSAALARVLPCSQGSLPVASSNTHRHMTIRRAAKN